MTSVRPYQGALGAEQAVAEISRCAGAQFDPDVAKALAELLAIGFDDRAVIDLDAATDSRPMLPADPFAATA